MSTRNGQDEPGTRSILTPGQLAHVDAVTLAATWSGHIAMVAALGIDGPADEVAEVDRAEIRSRVLDALAAGEALAATLTGARSGLAAAALLFGARRADVGQATGLDPDEVDMLAATGDHRGVAGLDVVEVPALSDDERAELAEHVPAGYTAAGSCPCGRGDRLRHDATGQFTCATLVAAAEQ